MSKFQSDLKIGQQAENYMSELCTKYNFSCSKSPKGCKGYDLLINEKIKVEVKFDIYSKKSGNIAIEFYNPKTGLPSGIMATDSNIWIYFLGTLNDGYFIETTSLKEMIKMKPIRIIENGGDKNASLMLYKIDDVIHLFSPLENLWLSI